MSMQAQCHCGFNLGASMPFELESEASCDKNTEISYLFVVFCQDKLTVVYMIQFDDPVSLLNGLLTMRDNDLCHPKLS